MHTRTSTQLSYSRHVLRSCYENARNNTRCGVKVLKYYSGETETYRSNAFKCPDIYIYTCSLDFLQSIYLICPVCSRETEYGRLWPQYPHRDAWKDIFNVKTFRLRLRFITTTMLIRFDYDIFGLFLWPAYIPRASEFFLRSRWHGKIELEKIRSILLLFFNFFWLRRNNRISNNDTGANIGTHSGWNTNLILI